MQIVINLPDTNITENIIRAAKWEDGSLFDRVLRGAIKDAIILPKGATNGDVIKAMFPNISNSDLDLVDVVKNARSWWNSPYKVESEEEEK